MKLIIQTPKQVLKAFLKQKPLRSDIDRFKANLIILLDKINIIEKRPKDESEEHLKNDLRDFLRDTYYRDTNAINTKDKKDLVIHLAKTTDSEVGVIIEAKRPSNIGEMISESNSNKKAIHELILYYLNERSEKDKKGNNELKQLIVTNINEWYIIDANYFDKHIYRNTQIKKLYETKLNDKKDNPWFYEEIGKIVSKLDIEIPCTYFNIQTFDNILRNNKKEDDRELIALFKILSPQYLLKQGSANDSNSLNEKFYNELLHIIGLEEAKENGRNIIRRKKENRNSGSLIEATIESLVTEDVLHRLPDQLAYGETKEDRLFNVSLELGITWINRILFLKLLEGQLITYHQGNKDFCFLNISMINDFDELFKLFHKVLAVNTGERSSAIKTKYSKVPYLNSSLFEISELEDQTIKINSLDNSGKLSLFDGTILKASKKSTNQLPTLEYLFQFLDAYDFSSEGPEDVQEDNKTIINASVLGKVFEKINGYKDGSIFTPAFITMYMCKQSIRLSVVDKFNEALSDTSKTLFGKFEDLKNYTSRLYKTEEILKANQIINSLRICDPAVGSGHFLVSALNEIISIKSELGILADQDGVSISGYEIEIINDELIITDPKANILAYKLENGKPINKEVQRLQKALFHEKQNIIENCLFGVDINPNSVKICRLRLWIELLKNAYYKEGTNYLELETLPNIDINIKCGNSLLSRFAFDADLSKALKSIKYDINSYRGFVNEYKNEKNRDVKRGIQIIIDGIKSDFKTEILKTSKEFLNWKNAKDEIDKLTKQYSFFEMSPKEKKKFNESLKSASDKMNKYEVILEEIKTNALYRNAFEWRFEFPEVLNNDGEFIGFDLIIGNPPYMLVFDEKLKKVFEQLYPEFKRNGDLYVAFFKLGFSLLKPNACFSFITPNTFIKGNYFKPLRNYLSKEKQMLEIIDFGNQIIFEGVNVFCAITTASNKLPTSKWLLKSDLYKTKGFIEPLTSDFILKNELISRLDKIPKFDDYFLIKDVGFNYWSEGRGKVRGGSIGSRVFYNGDKVDESDIPFIKGVDIQRYSISFSNNYLKHNWQSFLDKNDTFRFSQELMERIPKIIYRQTSNRIVAALDVNQNFNDKTVHIIVNKEGYDFNLKWVLAILNSKMMNYFFQSFKEEEGRAFAQVKTVDIKNLPFIIPSADVQSKLIKLVDNTLLGKQHEVSSNTDELENQIDQLVYELYNITQDEIKIIEQN